MNRTADPRETLQMAEMFEGKGIAIMDRTNEPLDLVSPGDQMDEQVKEITAIPPELREMLKGYLRWVFSAAIKTESDEVRKQILASAIDQLGGLVGGLEYRLAMDSAQFKEHVHTDAARSEEATLDVERELALLKERWRGTSDERAEAIMLLFKFRMSEISPLATVDLVRRREVIEKEIKSMCPEPSRDIQ